jgi:hypothetical protein
LDWKWQKGDQFVNELPCRLLASRVLEDENATTEATEQKPEQFSSLHGKPVAHI